MLSIIYPLLFLLSFNQTPPTDDIDAFIEADIPYLVQFYKERHQHPEISLREKETAAALAKELTSIGFDVTEEFGGHGIVGIFKNGDGPMILYRTDMDALPMQEKTELPYQSQVTTQYNGQEVGAMHSCGHDMHMTNWVGTARAMMAMKDKWKGTLMMIGQPAEEIGQGAKMMLNNGLYDKFGVPDYGLGLHCIPTLKAGEIGISEGFTMANTETVDILVKGVGAHGASPHMSVDPVVLASMIVMEIQTIVSRNIKPIDDAVITVGAIKGGTKHNIIPDEVRLQLTIRTYKEEVRLLIHKRLREITKGIAISAGLGEDKYPEVIIPDDFTPANYNDPQMTERIKKAAANVIGAENVKYAEPQMVGEDFACYGRSTEHKVPTVLYWLGTVTQEKIDNGDLPGLHSPYYYPDPENTIASGIKVNTAALLDLFNN